VEGEDMRVVYGIDDAGSGRLVRGRAAAPRVAARGACQSAPPPPASSGSSPAASPGSAPAAADATPAAEDTIEPAPDAAPMPAGIAPVVETFKGDFDGMVKRRVIRVLTVQTPILYFVDRGREVGIGHATA